MLLMSCSSLTPERINVLAQIAASAAQIGAQIWLEKNPQHRDSFNLVMAMLQQLIREGETREFKYAEVLQSLPTSTLAGPEGAVYVSGTPKLSERKEVDRLVVYDEGTGKSYNVGGDVRVQRAIVNGFRRGLMPRAPMPGKGMRSSYSTAKMPGMPTNSDWKSRFEPYPGAWAIQTNTLLMHEGIFIRTNWTETVTVNLIGKTNVTRSVVDVQEHAGSASTVNIRWAVRPGSVYHIERQAGTNWLWFGSLTNVSGTGATNWATAWPPNVSPGAWRVVRVR